MEDKMGMALDEIHISGRVPQCEFSMPIHRRTGSWHGEVISADEFLLWCAYYTIKPQSRAS